EELRVHPDNADLLAELGLIDAGLGRKEDALNEGRRALELAPNVKDEFTEPYVKMCFAIISTWTGERELALGQLEALTKTPGSHGGRSRTRDCHRLTYSNRRRSRPKSGGYLSPRRDRQIRRAQRNRPADQAAARDGLDH